MAHLDLIRNPRLQKMPTTDREWVQYSNELAKFVADSVELSTAQAAIALAQAVADRALDDALNAQVEADAASADAESAQTSADYAAFYLGDNVTQVIWTTDADTGAWPGDTTQDLTVAWKNKAGTAIADRVLRGTFTQAGATIAVTAVSNSNTLASASTAYVLTGDGTSNVRATITLSLPDTKMITVVSWTAMDLNTAGVTLL